MTERRARKRAGSLKKFFRKTRKALPVYFLTGLICFFISLAFVYLIITTQNQTVISNPKKPYKAIPAPNKKGYIEFDLEYETKNSGEKGKSHIKINPETGEFTATSKGQRLSGKRTTRSCAGNINKKVNCKIE